MKPYFLLLPILISSCASGQYRDVEAPISTVPIEIEAYIGKWYEIARYPNWFEAGCTHVTAEYSQREDAQIDVKNSCTKDGELEVANGLARVEGEGKLSVTFTPWLPFARGDYWVLGLQDYDIAVVGNPSGTSGWILAREPSISPNERAWAESVLMANGYALDALQSVVQDKK